MTVPQQRPQFQNQVRISPIMFLLPWLGCPNLGRMTDQAFDSQLFHEVHKPLHRSRGFDPHSHRAGQKPRVRFPDGTRGRNALQAPTLPSGFCAYRLGVIRAIESSYTPKGLHAYFAAACEKGPRFRPERENLLRERPYHQERRQTERRKTRRQHHATWGQ